MSKIDLIIFVSVVYFEVTVGCVFLLAALGDTDCVVELCLGADYMASM